MIYWFYYEWMRKDYEMKIAVISDIHGNIMALDAVLEDIDTRDVEEVICLGDLVGYLPYPNEVVDLLRDEEMTFVLGNHDQKVIRRERLSKQDFMKMTPEELRTGASLAYMQYLLTKENREFLSWCPEQVTMKLEGMSLLCVHGSPASISEYLYEDKEKLAEVAASIEEDILLCGHTHIPYHMEVGGKHIINPGSVGKPKDGDGRATYTLMEIEDKKVKTEVIKVAYDMDALIEGIEADHYIDNALVENIRMGK
jgi:putative phosphoesterase